jgi:hypothetical protein
VAAAAVVTILVSGAVIALSLPGLFGTPEPSADVAAAGRLPGVIPVVFTSMGQEEPMRVMRSLTVQGADLSGRAGPDRAVRLVETSSPGVLVPVDHAFYDPEESSRWW